MAAVHTYRYLKTEKLYELPLSVMHFWDMFSKGKKRLSFPPFSIRII